MFLPQRDLHPYKLRVCVRSCVFTWIYYHIYAKRATASAKCKWCETCESGFARKHSNKISTRARLRNDAQDYDYDICRREHTTAPSGCVLGRKVNAGSSCLRASLGIKFIFFRCCIIYNKFCPRSTPTQTPTSTSLTGDFIKSRSAVTRKISNPLMSIFHSNTCIKIAPFAPACNTCLHIKAINGNSLRAPYTHKCKLHRFMQKLSQKKQRKAITNTKHTTHTIIPTQTSWKIATNHSGYQRGPGDISQFVWTYSVRIRGQSLARQTALAVASTTETRMPQLE